MLAPEIPSDEQQRIEELHALRLLDSIAEERFDRITRTARSLFNVPIALISLIDTDRQWFKSRQGLDVAETPRNISFCAHAILSDNAFIIPNALADQRFADNPLVTNQPHIRFYAGMPLRGSTGTRLGTLCLIGREPREFDPVSIQRLKDMAAWAELELNVFTVKQATAIAREKEARLETVNQQLATALSLQQAIVDSTNYAIIATDAQGQITMFNGGAQRMLGYTEKEMCAEKSLTALHDGNEIRTRAYELESALGYAILPGFEALAATVRPGQPDEREWSYIRKDGQRLPVMVSVSSVCGKASRLVGFVAVAQDLSERKKIEQMKNEFISTVSHELRTPLTSIGGAIGLLAGGVVGDLAPNVKSLLDIADINCKRLARLVNDILDIQKIESGNMRFDFVCQPLETLVMHAINSITSFAAQLQVSINLHIEQDSIEVLADTDRLTQVVVNLLSNATKFSPPGGIVDVNIAQHLGQARVTVTDHGPGISDAFREHIFGKFVQEDSSDVRQKGGSGLGLSISKAIIERHNGRIDFISTPGVVTKFYFDLPIANPPSIQRRSIPSAA